MPAEGKEGRGAERGNPFFGPLPRRGHAAGADYMLQQACPILQLHPHPQPGLLAACCMQRLTLSQRHGQGCPRSPVSPWLSSDYAAVLIDSMLAAVQA